MPLCVSGFSCRRVGFSFSFFPSLRVSAVLFLVRSIFDIPGENVPQFLLHVHIHMLGCLSSQSGGGTCSVRSVRFAAAQVGHMMLYLPCYCIFWSLAWFECVVNGVPFSVFQPFFAPLLLCHGLDLLDSA